MSPWLLRLRPRRVTVILSELPGFMIFRAWDGCAVSWGMPGDGGLLAGVATMAAGRDGAPEGNAPGFPADGSDRAECRDPVPSRRSGFPST